MHLASCEHFLAKYGEEAEEILGNRDIANEMLSAKHIRIDG
jgi:hypothetical protein